MKVLNFQIFGDFAHFRPYYTTSSPTTYTIIPPTTVYGIIGAVLGLEKEEYYKILQSRDIKVGIGLNSKARKLSLGINLINTKDGYWTPIIKDKHEPRTPIRYEFLANPCYSIYVTMNDEKLLDELAYRIKEHKHFYTPSLGLANLIADIKYVKYGQIEEIKTNDFIDLSTAINLENLKIEDNPINLDKGITYAKERFVKSFKENRIPYEFIDILYSLKAEKISVKAKNVYKFDKDNITFL